MALFFTVDRHGGNYIIEMEGGVIKGVKGIDNDLAFGKLYSGEKVEEFNQDIEQREVHIHGKMPVELEALPRKARKRRWRSSHFGPFRIRRDHAC